MPDGRVALANQRIASWTGRSKNDLIGMRIQELLSVPARIFYESNVSPLLRMLGFVDEVAMNFLAEDGAKIQCLVNAAERRNEDGALLFTRLTVFNATERRRYERTLVETQELVQQEAAAERETSQLREQFIAVLGHDLRNPLASIGSGVKLLTDREAISAKGQTILSLMQGSVNRACDLIDNVLDFARGQLGGGIALARNTSSLLTPVLEQVIAEIVSISPDHTIRAEITIHEPVDCDRTRIAQLLSNLLGNAVAHGTAERPIIVRAETSNQRFILSVSNGGDPINEGAMQKLFSRSLGRSSA